MSKPLPENFNPALVNFPTLPPGYFWSVDPADSRFNTISGLHVSIKKRNPEPRSYSPIRRFFGARNDPLDFTVFSRFSAHSTVYSVQEIVNELYFAFTLIEETK